MKSISTISIAGTGNVASHLGRSLVEAGWKITDIYGRNELVANSLAKKLDCAVVSDPADLSGDLIILCIKDSAIKEVSDLIPSDKTVVHTSGAISINQLGERINKGVLYPLQSFSKNLEVDIMKVPFLLEASSEGLLVQLAKIAGSISETSLSVNSEERKQYHLSAVFINNFVNHLVLRSQELLEEKNLDWKVLLPLLQETTSKLNHLDPLTAQTGPARRGDQKTIDEHLSMLEGTNKEIYSLLTRAIKETYSQS